MAALPAFASAVVVHARGGRAFGVTLRRGISPRSVAGSVAAQQPQSTTDNGMLTYHGGPVLHSSAPYLIFWDPGGAISLKSQALMSQYFTDVAADSGKGGNVYGVTRQYYDSTGFADYRQSFNAGAQAIVDRGAYPAPGCTSAGYATCITDAQLQTELTRVIAAGNLPTDGSAKAGFAANAPAYFVVLPSDVNLCNQALGSTSDCASNNFCSYHASFADGGNTVLYAAMPMVLATVNPKQCQPDNTGLPQEPNADTADIVINDLSHEDNEMTTDPVETGWWDPNSGDEEADGCSITGAFAPAGDTDPNSFLPTLGGQAGAGTLYDQLINGHEYYVQSEWSNGDAGCQMQTGSATIFTEPSGAVAAGSSLTFSLPAADPVSSETWSFGDGSPALTETGPASASHVYSAPGTYTVSLTLAEKDGNVQTVLEPPIAVYLPPSAWFTFSPPAPLEGTPIHFDASGSLDPNPGGSIASYAWDFGDGTTGTGEFTDHTYRAGTYTVRLEVTDAFGLSTITTQQITVDDAPTAAFTISPGRPLAGQRISLDGSGSNDPDGTIRSWSWNFGDGQAASGATAGHAYATPGTYTIALTVTDSDGHAATTSQQIIVAPPSASLAASPPSPGLSFPAPPLPTAGFAVSTLHPAARLPVRFSGTWSTDPGGSIIAYAWKFGDGSTGSGVTPAHIYRRPGTYEVELTVLASSGLTASFTRWLVVVPGDRITRISAFRRRGSRILAVTVSGPGTLWVGARRLVIARARTVSVQLGLTRWQRRELQRRRRLKASVRIAFVPRIGMRSAGHVSLRFST